MTYTSTRNQVTVTIEDGALDALALRAACDCPGGCPDCQEVE